MQLAAIHTTPRGYAVERDTRRAPNAVVCSTCGQALAEVWRSRSGTGYVWCGRACDVGTAPTRAAALEAARTYCADRHDCGGEGRTA